MIKVKTPEGAAWILVDEIVAFGECRHKGNNRTTVRCQVWLRHNAGPFNLLQTAQEVADMINGEAHAL